MNKLLLILYFAITLVFSSVINPSALPRFSMGGVSIALTDILFLFLVVCIFFATLTRKKENICVRSYVPVLMTIFLVVGLVGLLNGMVSKDVGINLAVREGRDFFLYGVYFICLGLSFTEKNIKWFVNIVLFLACLTSFVAIMQVAGVGRMGFIAGRVGTLATGGEQLEGVIRVSLQGESIINFAFLILTYQITRKISLWRFIPLALVSVGFLLTFNRGAWVSTFLAIVFVFFFVNSAVKKQLLVKGGIALFLGVVIFSAGLSGIFGNRVKAYLDAGTARVSTVTVSGVQKDSSFMGRFQESAMLLAKLNKQPLLGFGLGARTQRVTWGGEDDKGKENLQSYATGYAHNGYVNLAYKLGALGLLAFLLLFSYTSIHLLRKIRWIKNKDIAAIYVASVGFVISIIPQSLVNPRIMEGKWILVIVSAMALAHLCLNTDALLQRRDCPGSV